MPYTDRADTGPLEAALPDDGTRQREDTVGTARLVETYWAPAGIAAALLLAELFVILREFRDMGWEVPRPKPKFGHGARATLLTPEGREVELVGCYHVSQHNTQTGRLTEAMLDEVIASL